MKNIRSATVSFGLVSVPVELASTVTDKDLSFRTLHRTCQVPINQLKKCSGCQQVIGPEDQILGFEFAKGKFVPIEKSELEAFAVERSPSIEIRKFVPSDEIEPEMVEKSYHLMPTKMARSYELLAKAMDSSGLVGLGKAALWGKERPCAVVATKRVLGLRMLHCADEIVPDTEIAKNLSYEVNDQEFAMAQDLLMAMRGELIPDEDLISFSRERITDFLEAKIAGKKLAVPKQEKLEPTVDLLASLKESVKEIRAKPRPVKRPAARKPRAKAKR